jgi:hypothetical protein
MPNPHRPQHASGKRFPSAAKTANGTGSTYGGISDLSSGATYAALGDRQDFNTTTVPPASADGSNAPLTLGHFNMAKKIIFFFVPIISALSAGVWWMSHMSGRVDQHEEDIKEVKMKTEKLTNDSAINSTKLQILDSQVDKLEDKVFDQAHARTKK